MADAIQNPKGQERSPATARSSPADPECLAAKSPNPAPPEASKELTAEEQMALYEKELRENDWGHQPC
jgi:hypothetical protein